MRLQVVDENGVALEEPYEVRIPGWTEERFFAEAPEDRFCEYRDGELIVHSAASSEHQDTAAFLMCLLRVFVSKKSLGKVLGGPGVVRLREDLCREPDIYFISKERLPALTEQYMPGAVDFVIEVLSEGSRRRDLVEKPEEYRAAGVGEYWVVDSTGREVIVHLLAEGKYQTSKVTEGHLRSTAVPGFWIDVDWLWRRPLPSEFDCLGEIVP